MKYAKLFTLYLLASVFLTVALSGWLIGLPSSPVNWRFTLPLLLCPLPALYFSWDDRLRRKAILICAAATYTGIIWYFAEGFFQAGYLLHWLLATVLCFKCKQKDIGIASAILTGFGAVMLVFTGLSVTSETTYWEMGWNLLYQAVWVPAFVLWMIEHDPKTQSQAGRESNSRKYQEAA